MLEAGNDQAFLDLAQFEVPLRRFIAAPWAVPPSCLLWLIRATMEHNEESPSASTRPVRVEILSRWPVSHVFCFLRLAVMNPNQP